MIMTFVSIIHMFLCMLHSIFITVDCGQKILKATHFSSFFQYFRYIIHTYLLSYQDTKDENKKSQRFKNISASMHAQSCPTLCDRVDCSLPGFSVHGILQPRLLEWVAMSSSREFSWPKERKGDPGLPHCRQILDRWGTKEAPKISVT